MQCDRQTLGSLQKRGNGYEGRRAGTGERVCVLSKPGVRESGRCPKEGDRGRKKRKGCSFRVVKQAQQ